MPEAKRRFKLAADTAVISCYEAGRDGFWLHRCVGGAGRHESRGGFLEHRSESPGAPAQEDRLDLGGLLTLLARYVAGDRRCWRVVRVPADQDEDARHLHRTWEAVQQDRTRLINRLQGLLVTAGVRVKVSEDFLARVAAVRGGMARRCRPGFKRPARRERGRQLEFLTTQLAELEAARTALAPDPQTPTGHAVTQLQTLRAIGPIGAWVLTTEIFGWRQIRNGRQLGALVGLVPALVSEWRDRARPGHYTRRQ